MPTQKTIRKGCLFLCLGTGWTVHLFPVAVPDKIIGLTLILDFIDRCPRCALPASAPGGGRARGRLRCPIKIIGLTLILDFIDRCPHCACPCLRHWRRAGSRRYRTQKLSSFAPTILGGRLPGKIGNANTKKSQEKSWLLFCIFIVAWSIWLCYDTKGDEK